jgi:hypothetical protein
MIRPCVVARVSVGECAVEVEAPPLRGGRSYVLSTTFGDRPAKFFLDFHPRRR